MSVYDVGDGLRATATFKNLSNALADPTAVTCQIKAPDGTITTPTPTRDSTGVYRVDFTVTLPKTWHIRFSGTGAVIAAIERNIRVRESEF